MTVKDNRPEEKEIERLLAGIKPRPSARFYRKMQSAPWIRPDQARGRFLGIPRLALTAFAVLVLVFALLAFPAVRTTADQIMHFFLPASEDRMALQMTVQPSQDPILLSTAASFPLDFEEAASMVDYLLKTITTPPDGMVMDGARYNPELESIAVRYQGNGNIMVFTQRPLGGIEEFSSIGASAPVEILQVRGVQGEYVSGGWQMGPGEGQRLLTAVPGTEVSFGVYWNPDLPQKLLRWEEDGMMYELLSNGSSIGKDELLAIAEAIH
jgi:hypothetical protein